MLSLVVFLTAGYLIGHYRRAMLDALETLTRKAPVEAEPFVTRDERLFTNEGMAGKTEDSVIVTPKTPQRIEWEEAQELERQAGMRK